MSILSDFEDRIGQAIEGLFAGAFRSPVQPAEMAKALSKAMDDGRAVGVGKVYAPVAFTVALSPDDMRKLGTFTEILSAELSTYLTDHARRRSYHLVASPAVTFLTHEGLKLGRFRVGADLAPAQDASAAAPSAPGGALSLGRVAAVADGEPVPPLLLDVVDDDEDFPGAPGIATLTITDTHHDVALQGDHLVMGRLADCDIVVADANVSRRHAALTQVDGAWYVEDLESTNGTLVNGNRVTRARLVNGDVITLGASRLVFHEPKG